MVSGPRRPHTAHRVRRGASAARRRVFGCRRLNGTAASPRRQPFVAEAGTGAAQAALDRSALFSVLVLMLMLVATHEKAVCLFVCLFVCAAWLFMNPETTRA